MYLLLIKVTNYKDKSKIITKRLKYIFEVKNIDALNI